MITKSLSIFCFAVLVLTWSSSVDASGCALPDGVTSATACCASGQCTDACTGITLSCDTSNGFTGTEVTEINCTSQSFTSTPSCVDGCALPDGVTSATACCASGKCTEACTGITLSCDTSKGFTGTEVTEINCTSQSFSSTPSCVDATGCTLSNGAMAQADCCSSTQCNNDCSGITLSCMDSHSGDDVADVTCTGGSFSTNISCEADCPKETGVTFTKSGCCVNNSCDVGCTEVTVSCMDGYFGSTMTTDCTSSGWKDNVTEVCKPGCSTPKGATATQTTDNCCNENKCGVECSGVKIGCMAEYSGTEITADCKADGTWSVADVENTCKADCPKVTGTIFSKSECCADNSCDVGCTGVTVSCMEGYTGNGTTADCGSDGKWSKELKDTCTTVGKKQCPKIDGVMFTKPECCADSSCDADCKGVTVSCMEGYAGSDTTADCGSDGTWSSDLKNTCKKMCTTPTGATVTQTTDNCCANNSCSNGCTGVTIECMAGYSGTATTADCQSDGTWSGSNTTMSTCKSDCPKMAELLLTQATDNCCVGNSCHRNCTGVTVKCADGYTGTDTTADCGAEGTWSKDMLNICTKNMASDTGDTSAATGHHNWTKSIFLLGTMVVSSLMMLVF